MQFREPSLIWLVGPAGAGKSTWAATRFTPHEIVSTDDLRARVGSGPADLDASADAFALARRIAGLRLGRRLTTVVDSLGFDSGMREELEEIARGKDIEMVAVVFETPERLARERNLARARRVPAGIMREQFRRMPAVVADLRDRGWRLVTVPAEDVTTGEPVVGHDPAGERAAPAIRRGSIHLHLARCPVDRLAEVGVAAEQAGFGGVSIMDHLIQIPQVGPDWSPIPEAVTALTHLATVTAELRLTLLVGNVPIRRPFPVFGRQLAMIDVLSGGRLVCGLGAGWYRAEYGAYGVAFPSTRERLDLVEDAIGCLRALWGPGAPSFAGHATTVPRAIGYPRPVQDPIPIVVGGRGERTLGLAARCADGWNVVGNEDAFLRARGLVAAFCEDLGRDPAELTASVLDVPIVGRDRAEVAHLVEKHRGRRAAATFRGLHDAGPASVHIRRYASLFESGADAVYVSPVDDDPRRAIERLAPVVAALG